MIKSLKKYNTYTIPFAATKDWRLSNVINDELLLTEGDDGIILEYIDFGDGSGMPLLNTDCLIALEQQDDDKATFREGQKGTGIFYPESEPLNSDGTFKRVVFSQIQAAFYNGYKNPTQIWGLENIDFPKSKVIKFVSDKMRIFDIPPRVFGEKILENSVVITDNSIDNNYSITDDGFNNLFAGNNIFAKVQEIGSFTNEFATGSIDNCNAYFDFSRPPAPTNLIATEINDTDVLLTWVDTSNNEDGFVIERSVDSGSTYSIFDMVGEDVTSLHDTTVVIDNMYWYRVYAFNSFGSSSYSNTASILVQSVTLDSTTVTWDSTIFTLDNI